MRPACKNVLLTVSLVLLTLVAIELLYRFYLFGWASLSVTEMNSVHPMGVSGLLQPSTFPEIVYEFQPNLRTYFKMARLETNSRGLRDKEYALAKPTGTIRVAVIGDSFTVPSGVPITAAYHTLLEKRFNEKDSRRRYEFINFAVGGYYLRQYLAVIKYKALEYDPDLILIGFCAGNDYEVPPEEIFHRPFVPKAKTFPFFESFAVRTFQRRVLHQQKTKRENPTSVSEQSSYLKTIFNQLGRLSRAHAVPIVIAHLAIVPSNCRYLRWLAISNGLHFVDVSTAFQGKDLSKLIIYPTDGHPNQKANAIFADRIYDFLTMQRLLGNTEATL